MLRVPLTSGELFETQWSFAVRTSYLRGTFKGDLERLITAPFGIYWSLLQAFLIAPEAY